MNNNSNVMFNRGCFKGATSIVCKQNGLFNCRLQIADLQIADLRIDGMAAVK
jgi:hypothetical protein